MTTAEEFHGLRTAYVKARADFEAADSLIEAERQESWMRVYAHDLAELVADADLRELVPA